VTAVVLYGRPECHLCEQARQQLARLQAEGWRFELRELDIEADEELLRVFLERIPVIEVDGDVVSELVPDLAAVRARLDTVRT
jgi:glutathione S-transferase